MRQEIRKAKAFSDEVAAIWQNQVVLDPQTEGENAMLRAANESLDLASAQKSLLIEAFKGELGTEKYDAIRGAVVSSDAFKALTLHTNEEN